MPALTNWWPGGGGGEAPDLRDGLNEADISPGIEGFLFTALIVALLIVVVRDMAKRMRRMKYRSQVEAELAGEEPEFPGEIIPAEISPAQQRARDAAAEARFGPRPTAASEASDEAEAPEGESAPRA
ncbi:hypothetical protein GCM10009771_07470 [Nesterenkonia flava]